jgi:ABC-type thiamine transport system substrate-binding protein
VEQNLLEGLNIVGQQNQVFQYFENLLLVVLHLNQGMQNVYGLYLHGEEVMVVDLLEGL